MRLKEKGAIWRLTYPFAHNNYTLVGRTLYYPKGRPPSASVIAHELIHTHQIEKHGALKFYALYLFALPLFWNPWRYRWEMAAYVGGSGYSEATAKKLVRGRAYGWLRNG